MRSPRNTEPDPLRGSVDLLVLKALSLESMHGWGIGARIQQMSKGRLDVNQGSLYHLFAGAARQEHLRR